jgi:hypothetical protein
LAASVNITAGRGVNEATGAEPAHREKESMLRIYTVARKGEPARLVRAKSRSAALAHVAADFVVDHASQDALVDLIMSKGVEVENATAEATADEAPATA